jgi:hypothetical protein
VCSGILKNKVYLLENTLRVVIPKWYLLYRAKKHIPRIWARCLSKIWGGCPMKHIISIGLHGRPGERPALEPSGLQNDCDCAGEIRQARRVQQRYRRVRILSGRRVDDSGNERSSLRITAARSAKTSIAARRRLENGGESRKVTGTFFSLYAGLRL